MDHDFAKPWRHIKMLQVHPVWAFGTWHPKSSKFPRCRPKFPRCRPLVFFYRTWNNLELPEMLNHVLIHRSMSWIDLSQFHFYGASSKPHNILTITMEPQSDLTTSTSHPLDPLVMANGWLQFQAISRCNMEDMLSRHSLVNQCLVI